MLELARLCLPIQGRNDVLRISEVSFLKLLTNGIAGPRVQANKDDMSATRGATKYF